MVMDIESVFDELGRLFVAKWSVKLDDAVKKEFSRLSEYEVLVKGIMISYKLILDDNKIIISYEHNSLRNLIAKRVEIGE